MMTSLSNPPAVTDNIDSTKPQENSIQPTPQNACRETPRHGHKQHTPAQPTRQANDEVADEHNLERSQNQLEQVIHRLETDKLKLKEALALYQQGLTLSKSCEQQLKQADLRLESIHTQYDPSTMTIDENFCLESSQELLQQWLQQLEQQPQLSLDEALSLYQKAMSLSAQCEAALQNAELSIQKLNDQGQIVDAPELAPDLHNKSEL